MTDEGIRSHAPLLDSYLTYLESARHPFTIPGHKQRAGKLDSDLGRVVDHDVPLFGGLDEIKLTHGTLLEAESLAAQFWGGDWARFSTGGSTHANQAVIFALGKPGDKVAISRTAHRSVLTALVLSGLEPLWLSPEIDATTGVPKGIPISEFERVLNQKPIALLLTEPGYLGTVSDLSPLIALAHSHKIPVIVDAAWGGHFGFHPAFPQNPLQAGADVFITSVHKALPGYSASALVVARLDLLSRARLEQGFESTHTTSPAGAPLASIDGVRALLEIKGELLLDQLLDNVMRFRKKLTDEFGLNIFLSPTDFPPQRFDPAKLVLRANVLGGDGVRIEQQLIGKGVRVEMADRDTVVFLVTISDDEETLDSLYEILAPIIRENCDIPRQSGTALSWSVKPIIGISLREAYFADSEMVSAEYAVGRFSADLVAPYPPGVAVLAPGEVITAEIVAGLRETKADGVRIAYATDPTLSSYRVCRI